MQSIKQQGTKPMLTEKRFLYCVPSMNIYLPFKALSKQDAQHQFINSDFAPYYGQAILLTPDD
jgi:hypothetical protein